MTNSYCILLIFILCAFPIVFRFNGYGSEWERHYCCMLITCTLQVCCVPIGGGEKEGEGVPIAYLSFILNKSVLYSD